MEENKEVEKLDMSKAEKLEEVKIFGFGSLLNWQKKTYEKLDKIQKFLYFLERRQDEMFKWMKENPKV